MRFEHKGLKCLILRMESLGHLCGYVGVDNLPSTFNEYEIDVHGGVTYNQSMDYMVSDTMKEYFSDCTDVIEFDAAHYMNVSPYMSGKLNLGGTYKNMLFMKDETIKLAEQLLRKELTHDE